MTVQGTVSKTFLCLAILSAAGIWSWNQAADRAIDGGLIMGAAIGGLVIGLVTSFNPPLARWTAPIYSALQGVLLGAVSQFIEQRYYKGIALQAVGLTACTMLVMLTLYATRLIRVTEKLRMAIVGALGALMLFYLITMLMSLFGVSMPAMDPKIGAKVGIIFSLFVVGLAAFCLLLDFDMIEQGAAYGAPRSYEWYGAFGLMVSLIWLYWQILSLLMRLYNDRR